MPAALQGVSRLVPATYYIDILNGLYLRDLGLERLWPSFLILAAMAALVAALNVRALRKEGL
jgi:ABC-2 type transport system permease protein